MSDEDKSVSGAGRPGREAVSLTPPSEPDSKEVHGQDEALGRAPGRDGGTVSDPWLKRGSELIPSDARFACRYQVYFGVDSDWEEAHFRRADGHDELWLAGWETGCAFSNPTEQKDPRAACLGLLDRLFRSRVGFLWPTNFLEAGLVEEEDYRDLVAAIEGELRENAAQARATESEIVDVARELRLNPRPTGTGSQHWQASCPGRNHPLYIDAGTNAFGCGWCCKKGGPEQLRQLVRSRKR